MRYNQGKGQEGVASERRIEAFKLYKQGWTQRRIAAKIGISQGRVCQYLKEELKALASERRELAKEILELELRRLDDLLEVLTPLAIDLADKDAIDRILRIQERRAKLLGLDKPELHNHVFSIADLVRKHADKLD